MRAGRAQPSTRSTKVGSHPEPEQRPQTGADSCLDLQQVAGNRAVARLITDEARLQRKGGAGRDPRPLGFDVASTIAKRAPALFPAVPADQIVAHQRWVDSVASNQDVGRRMTGVVEDFYRNYPGLRPRDPRGEPWRGHGPTLEKVDKIGRESIPVAKEGPAIEVPTEVILADDMRPGAGPPFHSADTKLRDKWRERLVASPRTKLWVSDEHWGVMLLWNDERIPHDATGRVGVAQLMGVPAFAEEYEREVREPMHELRGGIAELKVEMEYCRKEHAERSAANNAHWYSGIFRHVAEALGEGDEDYPTTKLWNEPQAMINQALEAHDQGHMDIAAMRYLRAHAKGTAQAERYWRYEKRIQTGGSVAVKWLERLKTAGTIAASIAGGGLGIVARAGVAGGYAFAREGAQQVSEVAHGARGEIDLSGMAKQATVEAAMALVGGKIEGSFQTALQARVGVKLAAKYGPDIAEKGVAIAAAGASGFYTAPAQAVLESIIQGKRMPGSMGELADMIADEALTSVAMEGALGAVIPSGAHGGGSPQAGPPLPGAPRVGDPSAKAPDPGAATAGGGTPGATSAGTAPTSQSRADPAAATQAGATGAPHVFELAARAHQSHRATDAFIDHFGSWEQTVARLRSGTGDAAGISEAMRGNLLTTLKARRDALMADLKTRFNAAPVGSSASTEHGSDVDLNIAGPNAGLLEIQARAFLEQTHPGWEKRFRMGLMVGSTRMGALGQGVAGLPADLRAQVERRQVLATEAYNLARQARGSADPAERAALLARIGDPELRSQAQWMVDLDPGAVASERAQLLVASDRARAQAGRAASPGERAERIQEAMEAQMRANALDAQAYVSGGAIRAVVLGKRDLRPAERYQAVVDQVAMIQHVAAEAGGMRAALRRYETFKYIGRIVDQLRAAGVSDARLTFLKNHAELVAKVDRGAVSTDAPRQVGAADLGQKADQAGARYEDLGTVPGVSSSFLADVHAMLGGVLDTHLPALRAGALGGDGGGIAPPVRLPPLGPEPPPPGPGPGGGGPGPAGGGPGADAPSETGLQNPDALERVTAHASSPGAMTSSGDLRAYVKSTFGQIEAELKALGTIPPQVVVRDLGDPALNGHYDPKLNLIVVNEGAGGPGANRFDPADPEGRRRLLRLLLHESRHAEQWFHALRHMKRTKGPDWMKTAAAAGVHHHLIFAADAHPLPPGRTPESDRAEVHYEEFLGKWKEMTKLGQDSGRMAELREDIKRARDVHDLAKAALGRLALSDIARVEKHRAVVDKLAKKLGTLQDDLAGREQIYQNLEHEIDARKTEELLERFLDARELRAAAKRLDDATEMVRVVQRLAPHEEARAFEEAAGALDDYRAILLETGRRRRDVKGPERP